ncbi:amidohydrolase [Cellulomonas wangsupingiae]|uniref:Amidohydrolase family protein n=1 Tax=Cellulomonas wangsupingiae TaxID=2968085 RepID=A0ABY5K102_9CELL|nr:amidohydrolase family protein [Cellulomonas wangsupingiae]MCC2333251.1 amidohydrolase family protein [Cellulomonas wangsupingiae]UUI63459.1 amidohydrolase family protein [Cellulomonas wangsupingiae]
MSATLYRHGVVHSPADPFAEAVLVEDGVIAWMGSDDTADGLVAGVDEVVELDGALVAPAFVDAHVHLLETGLAAAGLDLSAAGGVRSLPAALDAVARVAAERAAGDRRVVLGTGWDDGAWPERRPPTRDELDVAGQGLPVYLARVDVHSAIVSSALADLAGLRGLPGWSEDGRVTGAAHHAARAVARAVDAGERTTLYRDVLARAAAAGIVAVHEQSAPHVDTRDGLRELMAMTADPVSGLPLVVGYRAEPCVTVDDARALLADLPGLTGIGGDLNVDGSLGSRTAALRHPYADAPTSGALQLTAEQIANHVTAVTRAGSHAAFHVIGDRALDELLLGLRTAADVEGTAAIAAAGHRLEHAEMVDAHSLAQIVLLGLRLSVQPAFDAAWGGPDGMYAARLGPGRAAALNPLADLAAAGVPLALGSDAPVTPLDPWAGVRAAAGHHEPDQRISVRAAFRAATRGGWRLAGLDHAGIGELRVGAPAHLAVWRAEHLVVQASRTSSWSADARAGSPLLPDLGPDQPSPQCLRTVRAGVVLHDALG